MSRYYNDYVAHYACYNDEDYVAHHGVLGMKWGVRRYQNKDGSLTPRGRARLYGKDGKETLEHRLDRAIDAAKYDYDISDVDKKLSKATKGRKISKLQKKRSKYENNKRLVSDGLSKTEIKYGKVHEKADREPVIYITRDAFGRPMYSAAMDENYLKAMKKLQSDAKSEYEANHGKARR